MRYLGFTVVVLIVLVFAMPLVMSLGRKFATWARSIWKEADRAELTLVKKDPPTEPPKQEK